MNFFMRLISTAVTGHNYFAERHAPPPVTVDDNGIIHATNYIRAAELRDGITIPGDVYKTITRVGHNQWRAGVEKFNTDKLEDE